MRRQWVLIAAVILVLAAALVWFARQKPDAPRGVVVTTTMLECAVRDLLPQQTGIPVVALIPGGSCPGHFDVTPSVAGHLRAARLILAHSYQESLAKRLGELAPPEAKLSQIETEGSLLIPENYLRLVHQTAEVLVEVYPEHKAAIQGNLQLVEQKTADLASKMLQRAGAWSGQPVVVSAMQSEFCAWLKLKPVGEVARPEDVTPAEFDTLMHSHPILIIGNLQEGSNAAEALSERLGVPLVIFSNFPAAEGFGQGYEALFAENLRRLEAACGKR